MKYLLWILPFLLTACSSSLSDQIAGTWRVTGFTCDSTDYLSSSSESFKLIVEGDGGKTGRVTREATNCTVTYPKIVSYGSTETTAEVIGNGVVTCTPENCDSDCGNTYAGSFFLETIAFNDDETQFTANSRETVDGSYGSFCTLNSGNAALTFTKL